jgi:hypothetical protein
MVTDCVGTRRWDFSDSEEVFLQGSLSLLEVVLPLAICFLLWRVYIMNKADERRSLSILALSDDSSTDRKLDSFFPAVSIWSLLLYAGASLIAFNVGLVAVSAYDFLSSILGELLPSVH